MGSTGIDELREQVALGCRILGATGHDDFVWGHVSARDPDGQGVWMKASTFGFEEVTAERIILVGFDGEVLAGDYPPSWAPTSRPRSATGTRCSSSTTGS